MIRIFPAWSHLDRVLLEQLREAARSAPFPVDIHREIETRDDWLTVAEGAIRDADCTLLVLTPHSARSRHCELEVTYAAYVGKPILVWAPYDTPAPAWVRPHEEAGSAVSDAAQVIAHALEAVGASRG